VTRFDRLDGVRAAAMLLGVAYHATYAFMPDIGRWYPVQADATWNGFAVIAAVLHAVRMPVFFAVSGFFARLVLDKRGRGFLADRFQRLVVPFLVAVPLSVVSDVAIRRLSAARGVLNPGYPGQAEVLWRPLHLWFLEYAFLFCVVAWVLRGLSAQRWFDALVKVPEAMLLGSLATAATVHVFKEPQPAFSFLPQPGAVLYFGLFFGFGFGLYGAGDATLALKRRGWWMALTSVAVCMFVFTRPLQWQPSGQTLAALAAWLMVLGVLGPALKKGTREVGALVQSAYWVYLVHHPLVQLGQVLVAHEAWPAPVGYLVVVGGVFAVSFGSWLLVVRHTPLGPFLGGVKRR
jgi:glucans biosynthesis protein C